LVLTPIFRFVIALIKLNLESTLQFGFCYMSDGYESYVYHDIYNC